MLEVGLDLDNHSSTDAVRGGWVGYRRWGTGGEVEGRRLNGDSGESVMMYERRRRHGSAIRDRLVVKEEIKLGGPVNLLNTDNKPREDQSRQ